MKKEEYVSGEIIVLFKEDMTEEEATRIIEARGWKKLDWIKLFNFMHVAVPAGEERDCIAEIQKEPLVRSANLNQKVELIW